MPTPLPFTTLSDRSLEDNLRAVLGRIASAARAAGRSPEEVSLLPITKSASTQRALELHALGRGVLGESRAEELERKAAAFADAGREASWHFVGHLQRNKARRKTRWRSKSCSSSTTAS